MLKKIMIAFLMVATLSLGACQHVLAANNICNGSNLTPQQSVQCGVGGADGGTTTTAEANKKADSLLSKVIDFFSTIIGAIAVIMIIIGGYRYVASNGNEQSVTAAKNTILYSVIGLVIVAIAQVLVKTVLSKL